jgi:hypothetical protein
LRTLDLGHMPEAGAALAIASCLDDAALRERVGSAVRALGAGGLFLDRAGAPYPDLRSTALGALATAIHRPVGEVQTTFADRRGVWLLPVRQAQGNVVDLGTLYFGLWLMGDVSDPAGVV